MVNYSRFIGRAARLMYRPSAIESPFGRLPEKAPRWDLTGTEACGGRKVFSWMPLMVWEYLGIYRPKIRVRDLRGGHKPRSAPPRVRPYGLSSPRGSSDFISKSRRCLLVQEKSSRKFYSVWTPFDIPFL